jgi:hypothetical protein
MKAPEDLAAQIAEKRSEQLVEMLKRPDDWLPDALEMARAELQRRSFDTSTISPEPPPMPPIHLFKWRIWPGTLVTIWLVIVALTVGFSCVAEDYHFIGWWALCWSFLGAGIATCIVAGLFFLGKVRTKSLRKTYAIVALAASCIFSLVIPIAAHLLVNAIAPQLIPAGYGEFLIFAMVGMFWIAVAAFVLFTICVLLTNMSRK